MMIDYLYDGSFEGLLTVIYKHYHQEKAKGIYPLDLYQVNLTVPYQILQTNEEQAEKVYRAIQKKISYHDLRRIYYGYLSNDQEKEIKVLKYLELGFKTGPTISSLHGNPVVFDLQSIEKKVSHEVHRLKGLIRFSLLEQDILYAPITPDHDVVALLATHFCDRFRHENFVIHDTRRSKALLYNQGRSVIAPFEYEKLPSLAREEVLVRSQWRTYFDTIAIKERTNKKCQRNFMPVRYWENLTEIF
ncbi:MAG: TIGR03915 family putative DNA repair protein [Anaerovoracaceae bacterium]|jgi:probable DNA metabolism protein|nr:TIGR03915 family putative DNA repair protein [Anaerovoracaceae bacterium]